MVSGLQPLLEYSFYLRMVYLLILKRGLSLAVIFVSFKRGLVMNKKHKIILIFFFHFHTAFDKYKFSPNKEKHKYNFSFIII